MPTSRTRRTGAEARWLTASDGVRLRAVVWRGGRQGTAVIFPGRTEFAEKYGRVAGELVARGLSVLVIDWRGQGLSDRHPANAMLGHIEDFRTYQLDVAALLDLEARAGPARAALPGRAFHGRLHRPPDAARAGGLLRRGLLGADVAPADEGRDPRADRQDDPARQPRGLRRSG